MQGQANHFVRYAPEQIPYAQKRYQNETKRLYSVLQSQIEKRGNKFILGDKYTIADTKTFTWVRRCEACGVDLSEFPGVKAWVERCEARPGVKEGLQVPQ